MLLRDGDFEATLSHNIYFKKCDNESNFASYNLEKV
jgi:hypothetical protein